MSDWALRWVVGWLAQTFRSAMLPAYIQQRKRKPSALRSPKRSQSAIENQRSAIIKARRTSHNPLGPVFRRPPPLQGGPIGVGSSCLLHLGNTNKRCSYSPWSTRVLIWMGAQPLATSKESARALDGLVCGRIVKGSRLYLFTALFVTRLPD